MKRTKRLMCLLLAAVMLLALAGCGKGGDSAASPDSAKPGKSAETPAPEFVYTANYKPLREKSEQFINIVGYNEDGSLYYTTMEKIGEQEHGDEKPAYEGQFDIYGSFLYYRDPKGQVSKVEAYSSLPPEENVNNYKNYTSSSSTAGMRFTEDGGFVSLEAVFSSWQEGDGDFELYSEDYWNSQKYSQKYYIRWFDKDGHELSCAPVEVPQDSWLDGSRMQIDDKGNVVASAGMGLRAIAPDGSDAYTIDTQDYVDGLVRLGSGQLGAVVYAEQQMLCLLDTDTGRLKDGVPVSFDTYSAYTGNGEYDLFYTNGTNFYGWKMDGNETVKLFNWLNCDVNSNNVQLLGVADDGTVTGYVTQWNDADQTYNYELVQVSQVPYDSVPHKESIRMAVVSMDYRLQEMVIDYNRHNDKYRIEVTDYSEYNSDEAGWDAGLTKLNTEILSGNVPDIFCLQELNYTQLASKGILEDLYPYIDADPELSRDDFFPNIMKAMEVDGKLYRTVSGFMINSVIGSASVVGDEPGWDYNAFNAALAEMRERVPECTAFDQYVTRDGILQTCLALDMESFVDWTTGKCSFDNDQFVQLLQFANSFPAEFDWEHYEWSAEESTEDRLAQGKQMLVQTAAYSIDDIFYNNYPQFLGGKITYVGYPTVSGTGNMINLTEASYAMSSKTPYKEAVWDFLRTFFTKQFQSGIYTLTSRVDVFEDKAQAATTIEYQKDENGKFALDEDGEKIPVARAMMWDQTQNKSIPIYALEQEQVDQIRDLILSTTKVGDYNQEILNIVSEQAAPYFEGQKSAEEVARLIQSKVNIYVNEQR